MKGISAFLRPQNLRRLAGAVVSIAVGAATQAMTVEQQVTAAYVKEHPKELSVKAVEGKNGLLNFTIVRNLAEPRYFVAHLSVSHSGEIVAESDTPVYGRKNDNTFHFSMRRQDVEASQFILGESALANSGDCAVPVPGTIDYKITLQEFVPQKTEQPASSGRD